MRVGFEFATATRIVFGVGAIRQIGPLAKPFGSRTLIVTGRQTARAQVLAEELEKQDIKSVCLPVAGEPSVETVSEGVRFAKERGCDFVISFGGGSAIDGGKAIAAMLTNEGELLDYLEVIGRGKALARPAAPFIAIPTTAGTGSEVTRNAVLASPEHRVKVSLRSPFMLPKIALIDPALSCGLPGPITASTGLDALTQLIEPYVCTRANPMTDALCLQGIPGVARSLRTAFHNGSDLTAREDMALASLFGGLALANAGLGAVHGFAGPIGGMFPAPHGAICAALLAPVMDANIQALEQRQPDSQPLHRYREIAKLLTGRADACPTDGVEWVCRLVTDLGIPKLRAYGITQAEIPGIVEKSEKASSMKPNPIALTRLELQTILQKSL